MTYQIFLLVYLLLLKNSYIFVGKYIKFKKMARAKAKKAKKVAGGPKEGGR